MRLVVVLLTGARAASGEPFDSLTYEHPCSCASTSGIKRLSVCAATNASHERWSGPELMAMGSTARSRMASFIEEYEAALCGAHPERALAHLSKSALARSFDPDAFHSFMPDVNKKMAWMHALEAQMGVAHLWESGKSILALGSNMGWVDAYFAIKHNHSVTAFDMPWI